MAVPNHHHEVRILSKNVASVNRYCDFVISLYWRSWYILLRETNTSYRVWENFENDYRRRASRTLHLKFADVKVLLNSIFTCSIFSLRHEIKRNILLYVIRVIIYVNIYLSIFINIYQYFLNKILCISPKNKISTMFSFLSFIL